MQSARKDLFHLAIAALQNQHPDQQPSDGHGDVTADAENLHGRGHTGELRHHVSEIDQKPRNHTEERRAETELLADQVGEPLAGAVTPMRAHISSVTYSAMVMGISDHSSK